MRAFFRQTVIIAFVLWHTFAVGVYAIPRAAQDAVAEWTRNELLPHVTPYMLATSQWQLWNLFAPDPLRRVVSYRIDAKQEGAWRTVAFIANGSYPWYQHAARFKLLGSLLEEHRPDLRPVAAHIVQTACTDESLPVGTPLRLGYEYYVIPAPDRPQPMEWWQEWSPELQSYVGFETVCPAPSAS